MLTLSTHRPRLMAPSFQDTALLVPPRPIFAWLFSFEQVVPRPRRSLRRIYPARLLLRLLLLSFVRRFIFLCSFHTPSPLFDKISRTHCPCQCIFSQMRWHTESLGEVSFEDDGLHSLVQANEMFCTS